MHFMHLGSGERRGKLVRRRGRWATAKKAQKRLFSEQFIASFLFSVLSHILLAYLMIYILVGAYKLFYSPPSILSLTPPILINRGLKTRDKEQYK
jgi:hypothetical protein